MFRTGIWTQFIELSGNRTRFTGIFRIQTLTINTFNKVLLFEFESNFEDADCYFSVICIGQLTSLRLVHVTACRSKISKSEPN